MRPCGCASASSFFFFYGFDVESGGRWCLLVHEGRSYAAPFKAPLTYPAAPPFFSSVDSFTDAILYKTGCTTQTHSSSSSISAAACELRKEIQELASTPFLSHSISRHCLLCSSCALLLRPQSISCAFHCCSTLLFFFLCLTAFEKKKLKKGVLIFFFLHTHSHTHLSQLSKQTRSVKNKIKK